jgi:REP element-mobilizing transposase RayT
MPRRPRIDVEGAVYHVYNRLARGEAVFAEKGEAPRFVELLRKVRDRDGLTILAWCLMPNHYHLALRTGPVPLARSLAFVQARFSSGHNRRRRLAGPLWQSRYKAKLVTDPPAVLRLIAYVHLNPVAAGIVTDPAAYPTSGHRELVGKPGDALADVDGVLRLFGESRRAARRSYVTMLRGARAAAWCGEGPGRLPWWGRDIDRPLEGEPAAPRLDPLGRTRGEARRRMPADEFLLKVADALHDDPHRLAGGGQDRELSRRRYLLAGLAIERWRVRAGALAEVFGRRPEVISRWATRAGELRLADGEFARAYEALDAALLERVTPPR